MVTPPSRLGFGVSGAHGTPLIDPGETRRLILAAYEGGVRVFDTAPAYGAGEAERRLGAAVAELGRDRVFLTTKAGLSSHGATGRRRDFTPDGLEASVRASLNRLGVDGVDVLFLHGAAPEELTDAVTARLDLLARAGAFAHLGAAGRGAELEPAVRSSRFAAIMAPVHPFLDAAEAARLERAAAAGKTLFAIETAGDSPPRLRPPRRRADLYALAKGLRARLQGQAGRGRIEVEAGLIQALERPGVGCALFTTTRRAHLAACLTRVAAPANSSEE